MLKKRLIPKLQMRNRRIGTREKMVLVTTRQFKESIQIGDPVSQAKIYQAQAADELVFLDLDATNVKRNTIAEVIHKVAEEVFMPFTVGGGVRSLEDFRLLLNNGADKVSINTVAVEYPQLISEAARSFGSQCVVVSIDYQTDENGQTFVYINGGRIKTSLHPVKWAIQAEKLGAGEILLTCIDHDGMRRGLELKISKDIVQSLSIPVILSGGCGAAAHFTEGFRRTGASAVAAGTYFCFKDENPMQTRSQIKNAGIPIRLHI